MALLSDTIKRLMSALTSADAGNEVANAIQAGAAVAAQNLICCVAAIQATNVSQTVDFAALKVGDKIAMIPATAGNADYISCTVAGDLGQAAVVGNLYLVFRPLVLDATSALKF